MRPSKRLRHFALGLIALLLLGARDGRAADGDACDSLVPAVIGGPTLPKDSDTALFRWLANANY